MKTGSFLAQSATHGPLWKKSEPTRPTERLDRASPRGFSLRLAPRPWRQPPAFYLIHFWGDLDARSLFRVVG